MKVAKPCSMCGHHHSSPAQRKGEEARHSRAHGGPRATVRKNVFLKDMNVEVGAEDARQIEVLAQDLPYFGGAQLAVDVTLRCVLSCEGEAHPHAADTDGAVLLKARADKEMTCPEVATSGRCRLVVMAIETGGRWSEEAAEMIQLLSHAKARRLRACVARWR